MSENTSDFIHFVNPFYHPIPSDLCEKRGGPPKTFSRLKKRLQMGAFQKKQLPKPVMGKGGRPLTNLPA